MSASQERIKELQRYVGANPDGQIGNETLFCFAAKFGKTRIQTIHFFANIHHESGGFSLIRENMNYRAAQISKIFGVGKHSARITPQEAQRLAGKPYELAERVYGIGNPSKAKELGNKVAGDGWKYRGGGAIQITGGDAYQRFGDRWLYGNPDLIGNSEYYFTTAVKYFDIRGIWDLCKDLSEATIQSVTRRINGGLNGLDDRRNKIRHYDNLFKAAPVQNQSKFKSTISDLHLRSGAGTSNKSLLVIPFGAPVEVIGTSGAWSQVIYSGVSGWASTQYLR